MSADQTVVVTGASTGIGWGVAKVLLAKGFKVLGSVRREVDGDRLRSEFGADFTPLRIDITDVASVAAAARQTAAQIVSSTLFGLVNNAGGQFLAPCSSSRSMNSESK